MQHPYIKSFEDHIIICDYKNIPKDCIFEMHWHDYIEMEVVLEGEAEHIYNSALTKVSRGHAYIITPHDLHALHALSDVKLVTVSFDINILEKELRNALSLVTDKNFYCLFDEALLCRTMETLEAIGAEQKEKTLLWDARSKALLTQVIIDIIRLSNKNVIAEPTLARKAISYVHTNFRTPLTVSALAAEFSVTPNYMGKVFNTHTGMSFNRYLNEIRLKYVCNMLRFSSMPIADIAAMSGYSSVEYFFSVFKKIMGMTPREYIADGRSGIH